MAQRRNLLYDEEPRGGTRRHQQAGSPPFPSGTSEAGVSVPPALRPQGSKKSPTRSPGPCFGWPRMLAHRQRAGQTAGRGGAGRSEGSRKLGADGEALAVAHPRREIQTTTTRRDRLTPVRMAGIKKTRNNRCRRGCEARGALVHCWGECGLAQPLWRDSVEAPQKTRPRMTLRPGNSTTGYLLEEDENPKSKRHMRSCDS